MSSYDRLWLELVIVVCASVCTWKLIVQGFRFAERHVSEPPKAPTAPTTPEPPPTLPTVLTPGLCECRHARCHHAQGTGACNVWLSEYKAGCACLVYIFDPDEDDDDDDTPEPEPDPSVKELERIRNL